MTTDAERLRELAEKWRLCGDLASNAKDRAEQAVLSLTRRVRAAEEARAEAETVAVQLKPPPTDAASDATIQSPFATPVNFTAKVAALRQEFGLSADASYSEVAENVVSNFGLRPVDAEHGRPVAAVIREGYTEVFGVD